MFSKYVFLFVVLLDSHRHPFLHKIPTQCNPRNVFAYSTRWLRSKVADFGNIRSIVSQFAYKVDCTPICFARNSVSLRSAATLSQRELNWLRDGKQRNTSPPTFRNHLGFRSHGKPRLCRKHHNQNPETRRNKIFPYFISPSSLSPAHPEHRVVRAVKWTLARHFCKCRFLQKRDLRGLDLGGKNVAARNPGVLRSENRLPMNTLDLLFPLPCVMTT